MHNPGNLYQNLSLTDAINKAPDTSLKPQLWEEYSALHDSFSEQLAYDNSRKIRSDFWQLNCI